MKISIKMRDCEDQLTIIEIEEETSAMGDRLSISIISDGELMGEANVMKSDFVRVADMFRVPYE